MEKTPEDAASVWRLEMALGITAGLLLLVVFAVVVWVVRTRCYASGNRDDWAREHNLLPMDEDKTNAADGDATDDDAANIILNDGDDDYDDDDADNATPKDKTAYRDDPPAPPQLPRKKAPRQGNGSRV